MRRAFWLGTAAVAAFTLPSVASGQAVQPVPAPTQSSRATVYDAAFFAQYAPRTALDVAQRVPGFQLDLGATQGNLGSVDVRGFAGTAGNVVINGARPSTKAETLDQTLQRIPAQQVVRVEVSPGDLFGSDYAGKSQVLNIILSKSSGFDANVTTSGVRRFTGYIQPNLSGSAVLRRGPSTFNLSGAMGRNKQYEEGTDTLDDAVTGEPLEFRRKHNVYENRDPYLAGAYALDHGSNNIIRVNARWQPSTFDLFQRNRVIPAQGPPHDDNLTQNYSDPVIELGGDITQPLAGGAIKFVALATRRKRDDTDRYVQRNGLIDQGGTVNGGFEQTIKAKRNETIGRVSWTRSNLLGFSFEAGGEAALNTLDDHTTFFAIDEDGEKVPIPLPIASATVKEKRGEVYVNVGRNLSPALRIDGGFNFEFSHLTVSGDATEDRKLKFLKPNLTVDWKPGKAWHTQFSVRRIVAQLDFYDFISNADLSAQRVNGGNVDLQPQRTWQFRATVEHPIFGEGLFKLDLGHDQVSLLQDRILIFDDEGHAFDAPGNLGTGKRDFAQLTLDMPLSRLWKGLRIKGGGTLQRTRVEDPISHEQRKWSGFFPTWQWNVDVRRDSGPWSYGFSVSDNQRFTFYRTDEFDTNFNGGPYWTAFVEYRPGPNTAITLDVDNLFETSGNRARLRFIPNRAEPDTISCGSEIVTEVSASR
jgi:Outer membrane protein beta-barrel family/TonB-dependent Receptor Plug Domain